MDAQPNGFRIVTGGSDNTLRIWNILPCISEKYEEVGNRKQNSQQTGATEINIDNHIEEGKQTKESNNNQEDQEMEDSTSDPFDEDIKLLESLFETERKRGQRLLAVFENHASPVNSVRWNNIGTLFASAADDGTIILWEYKGEKVISSFERCQYEPVNKQASFEDAKAQFAKGIQKEEEQDDIQEDWKAKKTWKGHKHSVTDIAWSPDNMHFASCGVDSIINLWNINEHSKFKVNVLDPVTTLDQKANGLTFDPFGKFMASQSSEDKSLIIWRVQNYKNIIKEKILEDFYKESSSQSMFRRLSWSSDGLFISTTAGRIGSINMAPLIQRSQWQNMATLCGHLKSINATRINPKLYKDPSLCREYDPKTGQYKETLACYSVVALGSIDTSISVWKPHMNKPFTTVLDLFKSGITDLTWAFNGNILMGCSMDGNVMFVHYEPGALGEPISEQEKQIIIENKYGSTILNEYKKNNRVENRVASQINQTPSQVNKPLQQQQQVIVTKEGKKKIVPIMISQYSDQNEINPFVNPFQQLKEKPQPQKIPPDRVSLPAFAEAFKPQSQQKPVQEVTQEKKVHFYPPEKPQASLHSSEQALNQQKQKLVQSESDKNLSESTPKKSQFTDSEQPKDSQMQQSDELVQQQSDDQKKQQQQQDLSGKKSKKKAKKKQEAEKEQVNAPNGILNQIGVKQNQQVVNKDLVNQFERLMEQAKDYSCMAPEDFVQVQSVIGKEEIMITLPQLDMYSEELKLLINNYDSNNFRRRAEVKLLTLNNHEINSFNIQNELVVMVSVNKSFFVLCTQQGQLHIFSTRTTQLVSKGLYVDGVCFLLSNEKCEQILAANMKGVVLGYQVKNVNFPVIDSVKLIFQQSIQEVLRRKTQNAQLEDPQASPVYLRSLKLADDGSVFIFLTDNSRFMSDHNTKQWRELSQIMEVPLSQSQSATQIKTKPQQLSLGSIISQLDQQSKNFEEQNYLIPNKSMESDKMNELQEAIQLYTKMNMQNEFLHTLRVYVALLLNQSDYLKLFNLLNEYKMFSNEEDLHKNDKEKKFEFQKAIQNFNQILTQGQQEEQKNDIYVRGKKKICGMTNQEICQKAIMPPLITISKLEGKDLQRIIEAMFRQFDSLARENQKGDSQEGVLFQVQHVEKNVEKGAATEKIETKLPPFNKVLSYSNTQRINNFQGNQSKHQDDDKPILFSNSQISQ